MNYAEIKEYDIANGPGVRMTLFVSGCRHHCKNCFNEKTWDFAFGQPFTEETMEEILDSCNHDWINGLSLLGGEPFEPENQRGLLSFLKRVREELPKKTIWAFSGFILDKEIENMYTLEEINQLPLSTAHMKVLKAYLSSF